jgi:hypothetical protein
VIVYQLFAYGRWFSPGTPASSTTKTGRHDIAESGIKHQNQTFLMMILPGNNISTNRVISTLMVIKA